MCESYAARQRGRGRERETERMQGRKTKREKGTSSACLWLRVRAKPCRILFNDMKICSAPPPLPLSHSDSLSHACVSHITRGSVPSAQKYAAN